MAVSSQRQPSTMRRRAALRVAAYAVVEIFFHALAAIGAAWLLAAATGV